MFVTGTMVSRNHSVLVMMELANIVPYIAFGKRSPDWLFCDYVISHPILEFCIDRIFCLFGTSKILLLLHHFAHQFYFQCGLLADLAIG